MINSPSDYHFMVDFLLPEALSEEFMQLIPYQKELVNKYFKEGKLVNYALSLESSRLWAIFNANSELEVMDYLADLPLTDFMEVQISMLTFYNGNEVAVPTFSLN